MTSDDHLIDDGDGRFVSTGLHLGIASKLLADTPHTDWHVHVHHK